MYMCKSVHVQDIFSTLYYILKNAKEKKEIVSELCELISLANYLYYLISLLQVVSLFCLRTLIHEYIDSDANIIMRNTSTFT